MRDSETDWVGQWFELLEELGEYTQISFGKTQDGEQQLTPLPHSRFDGVSGLVSLLRADGELEASVLPRVPQRARPSRWLAIRETFRTFLSGPRKAARWHLHNPVFMPAQARALPPARAWRVFTREDTASLRSAAKSAGVSMNSFLLSKLNHTISPHVDNSKYPTLWMIPVSLHESIHVGLQARNQSGFLDIGLAPGSTDRQVEDAILAESTRGAHWGSWYALHLNKVIRRAGAKLFLRISPYLQPRTGVFTNLGQWGEADSCQDGRYFFAPVVSYQPFAATALTWKGQLGLGVTLHSQLTADPEVAEKLLFDWSLRLSNGAPLAARRNFASKPSDSVPHHLSQKE